MNPNQMKQTLLECLLEVKANPDPSYGICYKARQNLMQISLNWKVYEELTDFAEKWLLETARTWPLWTGSPAYFVPDPEGISASEAYSKANFEYSMWKGEYGALRMQLLDFYIAAIEKEIEEMA